MELPVNSNQCAFSFRDERGGGARPMTDLLLRF
jgi:hypothetical protein